MNLLLNFLVVFFLLSIVPSKSEEPTYFSCPGNNQTDGNPQISNNIKDVLSSLVKNTTKTFFNTTSTGENKTRIHGLAQCSADVSEDICSKCIANAALVIRDTEHCPNQSAAIIWYGDCIVRYSTKDFYNEVDSSIGIIYYNTGKVTQAKQFKESLTSLMNITINEAVNPQKKRFGRGNITLYKSRKTLFGLVQCTRDLTDGKCNQCLSMGMNNLYESCRHKEGCRVVLSSCYLRYEMYAI